MKGRRLLVSLPVTVALVLGLILPAAVSADIPTGSPTGYYYQYASFRRIPGSPSQPATSVYLGGGDVDAYGDLIYVNRDGTNLDVYQVTLLDSDGDGFYEPDQHPDNPDATGPIEERTLELVTTYTVDDLDTPTIGEIYAASDRVYFLSEDNAGISQYMFATGVTSTVVSSPGVNLSQLGYDDVNGEWYAMAESPRTVYKWDGSAWVAQFSFSSLAGGHADGLEVVTDPATNTPYVYVSDMTSDFLGQWRYDTATSTWVEDNLFAYAGTAGAVEGMGFGALGHFWATTGFTNSGTLYEVGGGELGGFVPKVRSLSLSPSDATNEVGDTHTVTATALLDDEPVEGVVVTFTVTGAHSTGGTATTDEFGQCTFTYTGSAAGDDTITATATIDGELITSYGVSKTWEITNQAPNAVCKDITVALDENGEATIDPEDVDGGSSDPDSDPISLSVDPHTFDCSDIGTPVTVTLTVDDGELTDTCDATVTVVDAMPPTITCPPDVTLECPADTSPAATGTPTATDNCGVATITPSDVVTPGSGNIIKTIVRTWTATDNSGNSASCQQTITVVDTTPPVVSVLEAVNPAGKKIPPAGSTTLPGPKGGINEDGFYELSAADTCSPYTFMIICYFDPEALNPYDGTTGWWLPVTDKDGNVVVVFSGTVIKLTEAPGAPPIAKKMGSSGNSKGKAVAVDYHITVPSSGPSLPNNPYGVAAIVVAFDLAGNTSFAGVYVPPPPK